MKLQIRDFNTNQITEKIDIEILSADSSGLKVFYVDFDFEEMSEYNMTAKFFLNEDNLKLDDSNFFYFNSLGFIFYRFLYQWGIH
ncbi:hypothetical protein [Flavobacterium foetidum]|uniref:hypothetical protein n=1 Tax=Flavobacterium foetidum TaxID=2026681 RepID=UPI001075383B|nr:hypothetical protein [Flavobacterium foetidum]KAF2517383.1 hypothetical protein E0W73_04610 [Flavobacterium foetidum]